MNLKLWVLIGFGMLSGCATAPRYPSQTEIAQTYAAYAFGPIDALFSRIGAPTRVVPTARGRVYVWHATAVWRGHYPVTTIHHGTVGTGNAMDGPPLHYTDVSTQQHHEESDLSCDLDVVTDEADKVQNVMVNGQAGACQKFML